MFPNDEVVAYGRANGLGSDYNDIMTAFLRDYYSSNLSLTDLWGRAWAEGFRSINGFTDFPGIANSEFYAPLTHSLVLTRGTGNPTYSRATNAWEFDNEGKLILVPGAAGGASARFGGARFVQNCVNQSQAFTSWTLIENTISATTGPGGVSGAVKLVPSAVDGYHEAYIGAVAPVNSEIRTWSIYAKASGYNYLMINAYANFSRRVWFNLANGTVGYTTSGTTASITDVGDGWYRCFVKVTGAYTGTTTFELVAINANGIGNNRPSFAGDATSGVTIWGAQIENVTGQADQTASEYVSVGALSAPYHGAGVDGVKWFDTNKNGSAISASSLLGCHGEGARTNSLLWARDLTNAAWAKTNITAAKTATGIDNAANSASTLTAGAADATILQTLSLAAAARSFSAYVTRRTGVGPVYITRDGFTTEVDISGSLQVGSLADSTKRYRVKIENSSVLNPQVGFKIATSGDAIDVDVCQDEAGAFASSPIITTTAAVTRNADSLTYANNLPQSAGSWVFSGYTTVPYNVGVDSTFIGAAQGKQYLGTENARTALTVTDGTKYPTQPGLTRLTTGGGKYGASWGGSALRSAGEGSVASGNFDGTFGSSTTLGIGDQATTGQPIFGHIKDVYVWQYALTADQLAQVTA